MATKPPTIWLMFPGSGSKLILVSVGKTMMKAIPNFTINRGYKPFLNGWLIIYHIICYIAYIPKKISNFAGDVSNSAFQCDV